MSTDTAEIGAAAINDAVAPPSGGEVLLIFCDRASDKPYGGIFNAVLSQVRALTEAGVACHLWCAAPVIAARAREVGAVSTLAIPAMNSGVDPLFKPSVWRAAAVLRRRGVAAVIHHSGRTWFMGALMFPGATHAQVLHRHVTKPYRFFRNWIALSQRFAAETRATQRWRRVAFAPNGLRVDVEVAESPPPSLKPEGAPFRVGSLGRVGFRKGVFHSKGFDLLVEAAALLKARGVDVEVAIGGGSDPGLEAYAAELGVADRVRLTGWTEDVPAFLRSCDVFCSPSRIEPFGLVMLEAMAAGLPIVATDTHGAADIVVHGQTGLIAPFADAEALADALQRFAEDPPFRRAAGAAGHARLRREYAPETVGKALVAALSNLGASRLEDGVVPGRTKGPSEGRAPVA